MNRDKPNQIKDSLVTFDLFSMSEFGNAFGLGFYFIFYSTYLQFFFSFLSVTILLMF